MGLATKQVVEAKLWFLPHGIFFPELLRREVSLTNVTHKCAKYCSLLGNILLLFRCFEIKVSDFISFS
jgi:hypothetical protein